MIVEIKNSWWWGLAYYLICEGCALCRVDFNDDNLHGCISGLVVHPSRRKKGLGTKLIKRAEEIIKNEGFPLSWIAVEKGRTWQKAWYERLGYVVYDEDERLFYLEKTLK